MVQLFIILFPFFFTSLLMNYMGYLEIQRLNAPPEIDTPEKILYYLEACATEKQDNEMHELLANFQQYITQKQLLPKSLDVPEWYHNPSAKLPTDEHWQIVLTDLKRESTPQDKFNVIKHWMLDINSGFTYKEIELMLEYFEDGADRAAVRKMYAEAKNKRNDK